MNRFPMFDGTERESRLTRFSLEGGPSGPTESMESEQESLSEAKDSVEQNLESIADDPNPSPNSLKNAATGMVEKGVGMAKSTAGAVSRRMENFASFKDQVTSQEGLRPPINGVAGPTTPGRGAPEKATNSAEGSEAPRSPKDELKSELRDVFNSEDPETQAQYEKMFDSMPPEKAKAMLDTIKDYPPEDRRQLMESLRTNEDIMRNMSREDLELACQLPGVSPEKRAEIFGKMSKSARQNIAKLDPEHGRRIGDLYAKTETRMVANRANRAVATTASKGAELAQRVLRAGQEFLSSDRGADILDLGMEKANQVAQVVGESGERLRDSVQRGVDTVRDRLPSNDRGDETEKDETEVASDDGQEANEREDEGPSLTQRMENRTRERVRGQIMKDPENAALVERADLAKRAEVGDTVAQKKLVDWYFKESGQATTSERIQYEAGQTFAPEYTDAQVCDRIQSTYQSEINAAADKYGVTPEVLEWAILDSNSDYYDSPRVFG